MSRSIVNKILSEPATLSPLPPGLFEAVDMLVPFIGKDSSAVHFGPGWVSTNRSVEDEAGARVEVPGLLGGQAFHIKALQMLAEEIEGIDLTLYPRPCIFQGPASRGAILGMNF
jgi:hypothetical protein